MALWGKRKREEDAARLAKDDDLARRARAALVAADERIRTTSDELEFAVAELGESAARPVREGLEAVRTHLGEAFHLHQLNHDEIPDTAEELRTRNARIIQLCEWADDVLDERTSALKERIELARQSPQILERIRSDVERLRARLPLTRETVERLSGRYSTAALNRVAANPAEAEQLLEFALHSADISARRREARRPEEANVALETATEAVRRAETIIDGVEDFEIESLRAQSTLADVIADSRGDIVAARALTQPGLPHASEVTAAVAALEKALAALPAPGTPTDPFADLAVLREANAALDAAVDKARQRAARPLPSLEAVRHAVDAADHQTAVARSVIDGHRGYIGADARTRLAEAQRVRAEIEPLVIPEDTREQALLLARRVQQLANEALQAAQRDIDQGRYGGGDGWGGGWDDRRRPAGGDNMFGGIVGGLLLGGLIGDIFE
ncbi:hypothetical protein [Microbacterium stercoris]|uniref:Uncharacterized protein n=1 Tax=Microbacterium stercoris TaxID=2820289 RepID=A0A939QG03_9MICO|nr:hypothetical protein [Microbacterium stercoris]MBO3662058.1 hypothetical protein [Microbacterium stercoris]